MGGCNRPSMNNKDLGLVRQALNKNGWFTVIDWLYHEAEDRGMKQLALDLDRAAIDLRIEIEVLGGTPDYCR